jgi:hypothetical protein
MTTGINLLELTQQNANRAAQRVERFKMVSAQLDQTELQTLDLAAFIKGKMNLLLTQYELNVKGVVNNLPCKVVNYPDLIV